MIFYAGSNQFERVTQKRKAATVFLHLKFDNRSSVNIITMIRFETALDMADPLLGKICLPDKTEKSCRPNDSAIRQYKLRFVGTTIVFSMRACLQPVEKQLIKILED